MINRAKPTVAPFLAFEFFKALTHQPSQHEMESTPVSKMHAPRNAHRAIIDADTAQNKTAI